MRSFYYYARYIVARIFYLSLGLKVKKQFLYINKCWNEKNNREPEIFKHTIENKKLNYCERKEISKNSPEYIKPTTKKMLIEQSEKLKERTDLYKRKTSGTTGEPTKIYLNRHELGKLLAVRDYCYRHYNIKLGYREGRVWARSNRDIGTFFKDFLLNRKTFYPTSEEALEQTTSLLKYKPQYLYGYSSLILELSKIIVTNKLEVPQIKCVICTAEPILTSQKVHLESIFSCPVVEEYGSTEFDILAFECRKGHMHQVNPWIKIEVENSTTMITDFSRTTQKIIRYLIGDHFDIAQTQCTLLGSNNIITNLEGRSTDRYAFDKNGTKFHSVELSRSIGKYQKLNDTYFTFHILQKELGKIILYLPYELQEKSTKIRNFIESEITHNTNLKIEIKIIIVQPQEVRKETKKNSYFTQCINT